MRNFFLFWLILTLAVFSLVFSSYIPSELKIIFLFFWMITWWISDYAPVGITALIPIIYLPMTNILTLKETVVAYSDPVLFLFLGGFILARALEKTQISELMAIKFLRLTGKNTFGVQVAFLISTAFISMWISNTATTMMMIPIALAVIQKIREFKNPNIDNEKTIENFQTGLMLILSYSSSLGGLMTPIGTPPNLVLVGILKKLHGIEIDFLTWMLATVPVGIASLGALLLLVKYGPLRGQLHFSPALIKSIQSVGAVKKKLMPQQKLTLGIFCFLVFFWFFKSPINQLLGKEILDDHITAIIGAILLFTFPYKELESKKKQAVLDSTDIPTLPWNIYLLFGGSMALASGIDQVGILHIMMNYFQQMPHLPIVLAALILILATILLTEIMSNVALATVALPIVISWAKSQNYSVEIFSLMVALAASFGFCLPMSTPPNAVVFGTGHIKLKQMLNAGWIMNCACTIILLFFALTWWKIVF